MDLRRHIPYALIALSIAVVTTVSAYAPISLLTQYDAGLRPEPFAFGKNYKIEVRSEAGVTHKSCNNESEKVPLLGLYNQYESATYMLYGFPQGSLQTTILESLNIDVDKTGLIQGQARLTAVDTVLSVMRRIPLDNIIGTAYGQIILPIRFLSMSNVNWTDVTQPLSLGAASVKANITDKLAENMLEWGGLDINAWSRTGPGDIALNLGWYGNFKQSKEYLRNVHVHLRAGYSIPSGQPKDEDKALSLPLGNDGAGAFLVKAALRLDFIHHIKFGLNVDIVSFLDETRLRRLKTHAAQTDFFLLAQGIATKKTGSMWRFCLYGGKEKILNRFGLNLFYIYEKHEDSRLTPQAGSFNYNVVNSAVSLQGWMHHNIGAEISWDITYGKEDPLVEGAISLMGKYPLGGCRVFEMPTIGLKLGLDF